jgi:hypothetical protein
MASMAKGGRILAGNFGAQKRFGFSQPKGTILSSRVPKFSDQYFVEFKSTNSQLDWQSFSSKVKSVSNIQLQTTSVTVDQYGKRVHVPTRVDFPEVTIEFYDTIDGDTFKLVSDIYENNFKNNTINTDNGALESAITDVNSGSKFTGNQQLHFFTNVKIFDFFGDIEEKQSGTIQKIELINPLSPLDYSSSELRTISITLQPENIKISSKGVRDVTVPNWMTEGLEYLETKAAGGSNQEDDPTRLIQQLGDITRATRTGGDIVGMLFDDETNEYIKFNSVESNEDSNGPARLAKLLSQIRDAVKTGGNLTGIYDKSDEISALIKSAGIDASEDSNGPVRLTRQLSELRELTKLYNAVGTASTSDERIAAQEAFIAARNKVAPMPAQDLNYNYSRSSRPGERVQMDTKLPNNIPDFSNTVTQGLGNSRFNTGTIQDIIKSSLINSFFNGTPLNFSSLGTQIAASIVGNSGVGYGLTAIPTASSRFGIGGDIIRDSINGAIRTSGNPAPSRPITTSAIPEKDLRQNTINTLTNARNKK